MPITTDISSAMTALTQLPARVLRGAEAGLTQIAPVVEEAMRTDPAHGDQSGAAHASYVVALAGGTQDAQGELDFAMDVAATYLDGFTGHEGKAARVDAPTLGEYQRGLIGASPVDYAASLAAEDRSPVQPVFDQFAPAMRDVVARGIRDELR
jgi:hypothetical protein